MIILVQMVRYMNLGCLNVNSSAAFPWLFGKDPDPAPAPAPSMDPAIFVIDLKDASKKLYFLGFSWLITFWKYIYIIFQR